MGEQWTKPAIFYRVFQTREEDLFFCVRPVYYEESAHAFILDSSRSQRTCFPPFLTLFKSCMDEKLIHSSSAWLLSHHLFRCFFSPSPRSITTDYFLLHTLFLPTQPSPRTTPALPAALADDAELMGAYTSGGSCIKDLKDRERS